ncbi:hypothetical protein [Aestuariimicrobium ganziense]|uniref:hypothetical protein n=1 Tax=Aestuariimicrobium ganziense TaxID=2773677 RepID=UPI0019430B1F|nr:hypothetical protein [Aestuariimicrobium ganziense]
MSIAGALHRRQHWLNIAVGVLGVVVVLVGLFVVGQGPVTCRGQVMQPGDTCRKGTLTDPSSDEVQTYEQRQASARASRPTVIGTGVGLIAFSVVLVAMDRRLRAHSASSDIGP